jgi:hypothetical protein
MTDNAEIIRENSTLVDPRTEEAFVIKLRIRVAFYRIQFIPI